MRVTTGWKDEFDYIAYVYNVLTDHIISDIEFMISRGVELDFVLKTFKTDTIDMWTPERKELFEAGVLSNWANWLLLSPPNILGATARLRRIV